MRADFYIDTEWIGSIYKKGDVYNIPLDILIQVNRTTFEEYVIDFIEQRNGVVSNKSNALWPWLWEDSRFTDYSYIFDTNHEKVLVSIEGSLLLDPIKLVQGQSIIESSLYLEPNFPSMKKILQMREFINGQKSSISL